MTEPVLTELYGLVVAAPFALPGWSVAPGSRRPDVTVHLGRPPGSADAWARTHATLVHVSDAAPGERPALIAERSDASGLLRLDYGEGIRFHVALDGRDVWCDWDAPLTEDDAKSFLLGPVLGTMLRSHGIVPLHASAVVIDDEAWAFVGTGGAGKSTLAAAFAHAGVPLLTEDVLALRATPDGAWVAHAGYAEIRLWDGSAELALGGRPPVPPLPPISATWPKRRLDLRDRSLALARDAVPLRGILVLDEIAPGPVPRLTPLTAGETLLDLVAQAYMNYVVPADLLALELRALAGVASNVVRCQLAVGRGARGIAATVRAVVDLARGAPTDPARSDASDADERDRRL